MNTELIARLMEAKKYQKKAIEALFPEEMKEHVEVIERELSAMLKECGMELLKEVMQAAEGKTEQKDTTDKTKSGAKKVTIS